ncbi:MAG: hypothetical protein ACI4EJ_03950 [Bacteroides sp.]|nr:hypothetical protein [Clostridia bacterium]
MLNESKIKMMTKMAIYEKNEGRRELKTAKYFKTDYVTLGVLNTVIAATVAYVVIIVLIALCNMQWLTDNVNNLNYASIGGRFVGYYIVYLLFFSILSGFVYAKRYDASRKEIKKFFSRLNKLEQFYGKNRKTNTES